jgi:hypothetical protein
VNTTALAAHCWRVDCDQPRLPYGHACATHDPTYTPPAAARCQRPLRCYCPATPDCLGHVANLPTWARPIPMPAEVRDQLATLRAQRAERTAR